MKSEGIIVRDLIQAIPEIPENSIVSQTVADNSQVKALLFRFAPQQELSEHTAAKAAVLFVIEGEAHIKLGEEEHQAKPGFWVYMPPNLPHSITAVNELTLLLLLIHAT